MRALVRYLLGITLLLLLSLLVAAGFLVSTQTGLHTLMALAKQLLPGELTYERAQGRLLGPLVLEKLHYQEGTTDISLASAELDWTPSTLVSAKLRITRLKANGIVIHLPARTPQETDKKAVTLSDIRLPLAVEVADLGITDIQIFPTPTPQPFVIEGIGLKAHTQDQSLVLDALEIRVPQGRLALRGQLKPSGTYPLSLNFDWHFHHPRYGPLEGQGTLAGDLQTLSLVHQVSGIVTAELNGKARSILEDPQWSAQLQWQIPNLGELAPPLVNRELSGHLQAQGSFKDYQVDGKLTTSLPEMGKINSDFSISGDTQTLVINQLLLTSAERPLSLKAQGDVKLDEWKFAAKGDWHDLTWPLSGIPQLESRQGSFIADGDIHHYTFKVTTEVQGKEIPKGNWNLQGQGSTQTIDNLSLNGKLLEGEINGKLSLRWQPELSWQMELNGNGLNPGAHWPEMGGRLNFTTRTTGEFATGQWQMAVNLMDLSGTLRGQEVQGEAQLALKNQALSLSTLQLSAGKTRLEAAGNLAQNWDLRWRLEVPTLSRLLPNAKGTIDSSGILTGPREKPLADVNLTVQGLAFGDTQIQRLQGDAKLDSSGNSLSQINLTGEGLHLAGQVWQNLTVKGSGTPQDHTLKLNLMGDPGEFALALSGTFKDALWQGRLTTLSAQKTLLGDWRLVNPVNLKASARQASAEQLCLISQPSQLCIQGQWQAASGMTARLSLEKLAANRFATLLPQDLHIDTSLGGELTVTYRPDGTVQGQTNLEISPGRLNLKANGLPLQIPLGGYLRAEAKGKDAAGELRLDLGDAGRLETDLQLMDFISQPRLAGNLTAEFKKLTLLSAFVPQLQDISGQLTANLNLSGTLPVPTIRGEVRLLDAAADIPQTGTRLQDIQLTLSSDGQGPLRLSGMAHSGSGQLNLSGQLEPTSGQADLAINGENFQAVNTPSIQALISPDIKLTLVEKQVRAEGQLVIPKAYLSPPGGTAGRVNPSSDVVFVNDKEDRATPSQKGLAIVAKIRVILGDDIYVEAAGFKGQLKGTLLVEETPQLVPRGTGTIEVVAGDYKIYGEEIAIERGRLLFSGGPIDNPGLDLRVARKVDDITAGAQVSGTLKSPRLKLFSTPSLTDSSILSYLVLGQPPQGSSAAQSAMLYRAATALGMSGGNKLFAGISETLNLDAFEFESGSKGEGASLLIGKYLTPSLYISYGVGLFKAVNTFKLRYRLSKRLNLETATSSDHSSADLIYTLER